MRLKFACIVSTCMNDGQNKCEDIEMSFFDPEAEIVFFKRQRELIRRLGLPKDMNIFDVGGNIGQSIIEYRKIFPGAFITTFEPLPTCFTTLKEKFGDATNVKLENVALAQGTGTEKFYATRCSTVSSLLKPDEKIQKKSPLGNYDYEIIEVPVDNIDNYCDRFGIEIVDILKIDVQGAELSVLQGAENALRNNRIRFIYSETLFAENYQSQSTLFSIATFLETFDYVLWDVKPFLFTRSGRLWAANAMFVSRPSCTALEEFPEEFKGN